MEYVYIFCYTDVTRKQNMPRESTFGDVEEERHLK